VMMNLGYEISIVGRFDFRKWQKVALNSLYRLHDYLESSNEQFFLGLNNCKLRFLYRGI
jgi:hypothetical protein